MSYAGCWIECGGIMGVAGIIDSGYAIILIMGAILLVNGIDVICWYSGQFSFIVSIRVTG